METNPVINFVQALFTLAKSAKTYVALAAVLFLLWVATTLSPSLGSRLQSLADRTFINRSGVADYIPHPRTIHSTPDRVLFAIGRREPASAIAFAAWFYEQNKTFPRVEDFDAICLRAETHLDAEVPPKGWETEQRMILRRARITIRPNGTLQCETEDIRQNAIHVLKVFEIIDTDDECQRLTVLANVER